MVLRTGFTFGASCLSASASRRSVVVFDLPYGTYHSREVAVESVISVVKRTGITTVKLEGFCPEIVRVSGSACCSPLGGLAR